MNGRRRSGLSVSLEDVPHHAQQIVALLAFRNKPMSTGGADLLPGLIGVADRENHNLGGGAIAQDLPHRNQPVQDGHIDIENYQVGMQFPCLVNRVLAIDSFTAYFKVRLSLKRVANTATKHLVLVGN